MRSAVILLCLPGLALAEPSFEDASSSIPFPHRYEGGWEHYVGGGVAVFDCNEDGYPDLFLAGGSNPSALLRNNTLAAGGALSFVALRTAELTNVVGAYPLDIDSDGFVDLAVLRVGRNVLLRGGADCQFEDATDAWGLSDHESWTTAFSAIWEEDRTFPTLVFGNYVDRADPEGPFGACDDNHLIRPKNGRYSEGTILSPGYCTLSMLISDWQRSGTAELRISNDRHYYIRDGFEEMWRLNPLARRDESDGWEQLSIWGMGIASADLTGDGRPEVVLTSMGDQILQFNNGDSFTNAPYSIGTYASVPHVGDDGRPSTGWHAEFGDLNNDGLLDLFIAKGNVDQMPSNAMRDPNNLLIQNADGTFREVASEAGLATTERSRGAALVDFDQDGRLDVIVVNRRAPVELWRNTTETSGNWLQVEVFQSGPNSRAVGAWVEVKLNDRTLSREITVGGGHAGGTAGPIHFGLGAETAAQVRAIWPGGQVGEWHDTSANQRVTIRRGQD